MEEIETLHQEHAAEKVVMEAKFAAESKALADRLAVAEEATKHREGQLAEREDKFIALHQERDQQSLMLQDKQTQIDEWVEICNALEGKTRAMEAECARLQQEIQSQQILMEDKFAGKEARLKEAVQKKINDVNARLEQLQQRELMLSEKLTAVETRAEVASNEAMAYKSKYEQVELQALENVKWCKDELKNKNDQLETIRSQHSDRYLSFPLSPSPSLFILYVCPQLTSQHPRTA